MTQFRPELEAGVAAMKETLNKLEKYPIIPIRGGWGVFHPDETDITKPTFFHETSIKCVEWRYAQAAIALLKAVPVSDELLDEVIQHEANMSMGKRILANFARFLTGDAS